jgi:2-keto-4-pentenoate hydratase/2-oxohepta-3-ene-1,7-dioic acid hydratase in catechol pathway
LAFASRNETVHAGEVFGSGTVGGCCGLEMDRWIKRGDLVELEVERIGMLTCKY